MIVFICLIGFPLIPVTSEWLGTFPMHAGRVCRVRGLSALGSRKRIEDGGDGRTLLESESLDDLVEAPLAVSVEHEQQCVRNRRPRAVLDERAQIHREHR